MSDATTPNSPVLLIHRTTAEVRPTAIDAMVRSFLAEMNLGQLVAGAFDDCPDVIDLSNLSANADLADRVFQTRLAINVAFTDRLAASGVLNEVFRSVTEEFTTPMRSEHVTPEDLRACAAQAITLTGDDDRFYGAMAHVAACADCRAMSHNIAEQIQSGGAV